MSERTVQTYETRFGPMLAVRTDRYLTGSLELYGEYNPEEGRLLRQIIRPGMTVVEIGANMGLHSVDLARACAPGPFYAFEPQPRIFQVLCANLALHDIANAFAYPEGCGEVEGEAVVPLIDYGREGNFGGVPLMTDGAQGIKVRVRPLDALQLPSCGLVKIDVEGFEPQVLRGARETITRCRPILYVENDRAAQQQEVISLVAEMGYRLYWHLPPLFDPQNFKGEQRNIFPGVVSINMLCIPRERSTEVRGLGEIDPTNWSCPVRLNS
ncbi:MAG TPA: FkbM family methyltransferase [Phenylobacterium sp.]|uniref:FkbM family methyltransferase n=1 Tax=Phenylobacterium sp. TaxID=1871053 RepID=UPI002B4725C0|nr:FkbM family methyltransferase [Phenylobacterium sp.]HKR88857.1 FkbM family methyltransferase [Phenylobacterium sp.]HKT54843.1 FkbM family methyltransferase [Caulobacteraceae bacterium]